MMKFENYMSTLFYLNEAIHYCQSENLRSELESTRSKVLEEAYVNTNIAHFKYYDVLKNTFSNLFKGASIKNNIKKTSLQFSFSTEMNKIDIAKIVPYFDENGHMNLKESEKIKLKKCELYINKNIYCYSKNGKIDKEAKLSAYYNVEIKKCSIFNEEDLELIIYELNKRM